MEIEIGPNYGYWAKGTCRLLHDGSEYKEFHYIGRTLHGYMSVSWVDGKYAGVTLADRLPFCKGFDEWEVINQGDFETVLAEAIKQIWPRFIYERALANFVEPAASGGHSQECAHCNKTFVSKHPATYCSGNCRKNACVARKKNA